MGTIAIFYARRTSLPCRPAQIVSRAVVTLVASRGCLPAIWWCVEPLHTAGSNLLETRSR